MSDYKFNHSLSWIEKQVQDREAREKERESENEDMYIERTHIYDGYKERYYRE